MVSHAVEHRQRLVVRVDGNRNLSALDTSDFGSHFLNFHAAFACTVWATVSKDYRDDWSPRAKFVRLPGPVSFPQIIHILDFETSSFRRELVRASLTVLVWQMTGAGLSGTDFPGSILACLAGIYRAVAVEVFTEFDRLAFGDGLFGIFADLVQGSVDTGANGFDKVIVQ